VAFSFCALGEVRAVEKLSLKNNQNKFFPLIFFLNFETNLEKLDSDDGEEELQKNCDNDDVSDRLHRDDQTLDYLLQTLGSKNKAANEYLILLSGYRLKNTEAKRTGDKYSTLQKC
jgi:hypothetical protein